MVELLLEVSEDGCVGRLGVVDLGVIAVVVEMAGCDETVSAWMKVVRREDEHFVEAPTVVPWTTSDEDVLALRRCVDFVD